MHSEVAKWAINKPGNPREAKRRGRARPHKRFITLQPQHSGQSYS